MPVKKIIAFVPGYFCLYIRGIIWKKFWIDWLFIFWGEELNFFKIQPPCSLSLSNFDYKERT